MILIFIEGKIYNITAKRLRLKKMGSEKFKKEFEDENITVYIFYDLSKESRRDDCDVQEIAIYLTIIKFSLPSEYEDYRNIFSSAEYIEIVKNSQTTYTINLTEDTIAFYKSIYHFFEKELRVLREYLKESQQKD
jgi:hypothetical protein